MKLLTQTFSGSGENQTYGVKELYFCLIVTSKYLLYLIQCVWSSHVPQRPSNAKGAKGVKHSRVRRTINKATQRPE